jgi:hypothetical protein
MRLVDCSNESPIVAMGFAQHSGLALQSSTLSLNFTQIDIVLVKWESIAVLTVNFTAGTQS